MAIILVAAIPTVARFIATKGLQKAIKKYGPKLIAKGKKYIKDNKIIVTGKNTVKTGKDKIIKGSNATKRLGGSKNTTPKKKITVNKNPRKKTKKKDSFDEELKKKEGTKNFNTRNKDATTTPKKNTTPKKKIKKETKLTEKDKNMLNRVNNTTTKTKTTPLTKAVIGTSVVGTALSFLPKGGTRTKNTSGAGGRGKKTNTSTNTILSNKDLKNKQNMQKNNAYSLDDMLDSKQVRSAPSGFKDKKSKPKGSGTFGANISFTGNNIGDLKSNARKLSSQIDALNITSMQKKRLKDELNTRKKNFGMGESYQKSFNIIKNKVKNQKFN